MSFGKRIRDARLALHLTQKQVASEIGAGASTFSLYEQDRREPNNEQLIRICGVLHCDPNYLFGFSDQLMSAEPKAEEPANDLEITGTIAMPNDPTATGTFRLTVQKTKTAESGEKGGELMNG